jgi:hypothetical protein
VKRIILLIAATVLLMVLSTTVVFAGSPSPPNYGKADPVGIWPPYMPPISLLTGVEKVIPSSSAPGGQIHIITDLLVPVGNDTPVNGWVTFWCQSHLGFQYNIGATGLEPNSAYAVTAEGWQLTPDPNGPITIEGGNYSIVGPVALDLGMLHTDANGLGSANGVKKLAPDLYDLMVYIRNASGQLVLQSDPSDPQDLIVY